MREEVSSLFKTDSRLTSRELALVIKIFYQSSQLNTGATWARVEFCLKMATLWYVSTGAHVLFRCVDSGLTAPDWVANTHWAILPAQVNFLVISGVTALNSTNHNVCDFACVLPKAPLVMWHSVWQLMKTTVSYQMELLLWVLQIFLWKGQNSLE